MRSSTAREAILAATAREFGRVGYEHLTIEGIAVVAQVSKQTIYRWWPSRGSLIADCLIEGHFFPVDLAVGDSGDVGRDLTSWIDDLLTFVNGPNGEALFRSLIAAAAEDANVGSRLNDSLGATRLISERLESAIAEGQLAADAPVEEIGEALLGAIIVRVLSRTAVERIPLRKLVDRLLAPPHSP